MFGRIVMMALLVVATACASGSAGQTGTRQSSTTITTAEIDQLQVPTLFDVIQQLRPQYLRSRGAGANPVVYVDGVRRGGIDELRSIDKGTVSEVRYIDGSEATTLYGTGHMGGAIQVISRR
jgi:hypothetical protein